MSKQEATRLADALVDEIRRRFDYDPESGVLSWKNDTKINNSKAGKRAGFDKRDGYRYVALNKKRYGEHRVIWAWTFGNFPTQVDHINMDRSDNRLCNLRRATNGQNGMNKAKQSNNTSGFKGVTLHKGTGKYHAKICRNGRRQSLGYYQRAEDAAAAYSKAAGELHGEFARTN